jgi:hypothetical protein
MVRRFLRGIRGVHRRRPMEIYTIGIDIGKTVFNLVGLSVQGEVVAVLRQSSQCRH